MNTTNANPVPDLGALQAYVIKFFQTVQQHPEFFMGVFLTLFVFAWVGTIKFVYKDAEARGKPGCLIALMVIICNFPIGYFLWIIFRPAKLSDIPKK